jgi:hypothetical protein
MMGRGYRRLINCHVVPNLIFSLYLVSRPTLASGTRFGYREWNTNVFIALYKRLHLENDMRGILRKLLITK